MIVLFIATATATLSFQSCKSSDKDQEDGSSLSSENSEDSEEEEEDGTAGSLKHPAKASAWATRVLINSISEQPQDKVAECIEQISAIAKEAGNQDDMRSAIIQTKTLVGQNMPMYHSCFYQIAARLDDRLAQGGTILTDMATQFFDTMKAMWIMARAMDSVTGEKRYFTYLRRRYVQISKDVFGRDISPVGLPFDERTSAGGSTLQKQEKPAGAFAP